MWANWQVAIVSLVSFLAGVVTTVVYAMYLQRNDNDQYPPRY